MRGQPDDSETVTTLEALGELERRLLPHFEEL
jgi:hypothetical protein